ETAWLPITVMTGLVAAAPLMFVDPDELALVLGSNDIGTWAAYAAGLALLITLVLGFILALLSKRINGPPPLVVASSLMVVTWIGGALVYTLAGQPGFYGEQLFVILRDQSDISAASRISDRTERLRFIYTTLTKHAITTQAGIRNDLDRFGVHYRSFYLVNAI